MDTKNCTFFAHRFFSGCSDFPISFLFLEFLFSAFNHIHGYLCFRGVFNFMLVVTKCNVSNLQDVYSLNMLLLLL